MVHACPKVRRILDLRTQGSLGIGIYRLRVRKVKQIPTLHLRVRKVEQTVQIVWSLNSERGEVVVVVIAAVFGDAHYRSVYRFVENKKTEDSEFLCV